MDKEDIRFNAFIQARDCDPKRFNVEAKTPIEEIIENARKIEAYVTAE